MQQKYIIVVYYFYSKSILALNTKTAWALFWYQPDVVTCGESENKSQKLGNAPSPSK